MTQKLPEELVRDIISRVLHIPDDVLNDTYLPSPFAHVEFSSSSVLLACKRWARVGTPLLHGTVVLRTRAQAESLCDTFKQNPSFSLSVKRLRLEGRCAEVLGDAEVKFPKLEQLCLALDYTGTTKFRGFLKFIRGGDFNLHTVAIADTVGLDHRLAPTFNKSVQKTLPSWKKLRTIVLPPRPIVLAYPEPAPSFEVLVAAAARCSMLRQLHLPTSSLPDLHYLTFAGLWDVLHAAAQCQLIILVPTAPPAQVAEFSELVDASLRARVFVRTRQFLIPCRVEVAAETKFEVADAAGRLWHNPLNDAATEVQTTIWRRVVELALIVEQHFLMSVFYFGPRYWFDESRLSARTATALLFTNRRLSRLVLCVLARHVHFNLEGAAMQLLDTICRQPLVASAIRSVTFHADSNREALVRRCPSAALDILKRATNLQSVVGWRIRATSDLAQIFNAIHTSGAFRGLRRVEVSAVGSEESTHDGMTATLASANLSIDGGILLAGLDSLEYLKWRRNDIPFTTPPSPGALDNVTAISTLDNCSDFLDWLALCSLARLRMLFSGDGDYPVDATAADISAFTSFLISHGSKIIELDLNSYCNFSGEQFALCPNLTTVRLREGERYPNFLDDAVSAPSVKTIYITIDLVEGPFAVWKHLQKALDAGAFTSLEDLHFTDADDDFWPTTDSELEQDPWQVAAAEKLKARGVTARNGQGRAYRTRLGLADLIGGFATPKARSSEL